MVGSVIGLGVAAAIGATIALTPVGWAILAVAATVLVASAGASAIGIIGTTQEKNEIKEKISSLQHDGAQDFTVQQQAKIASTVPPQASHSVAPPGNARYVAPGVVSEGPPKSSEPSVTVNVKLQ